MADLLRSKTVAAALGLFTHFITNSGEWDHHVHLLVPGGSLLFGALVAFESMADPRATSLFQAFQIVATATAVYLATLMTSVVIYRAYFHRLRKVQALPVGTCLRIRTHILSSLDHLPLASPSLTP